MTNHDSAHTHIPGHEAIELRIIETRRAWTDRPSPELIADGVVAGYIHGISTRHGNGANDRWQRRRRGER